MRDISSTAKQKDEVFMSSRVAQGKIIAYSYCRACTMSAAIIQKMLLLCRLNSIGFLFFLRINIFIDHSMGLQSLRSNTGA